MVILWESVLQILFVSVLNIHKEISKVEEILEKNCKNRLIIMGDIFTLLKGFLELHCFVRAFPVLAMQSSNWNQKSFAFHCPAIERHGIVKEQRGGN